MKKDLDSLTSKQLAKYEDSLEVLRLVKTGTSFYKASKLVGITPTTAKKNLGSSISKKNNRIIARKTDNLVRKLRIYENGKEVFIQVKGSRKAKKIGQYHSAIGQRIDKDNPVPLNQFDDSVIKDIFGKYHHFETNIQTIQEIFQRQENPEFRTIYKVR